MIRPWRGVCVWCFAASSCVAAHTDDLARYTGDTGVAESLPDCMVLSDRPPLPDHPWQFRGPEGADVVWGVRPAASWNGMATVITAGPGGGCDPCTLTSTGFGGVLRTASELAVELELGCGAEALTDQRTFAVTGVRLNLYVAEPVGPVGLLDLPLELTTLAPGGDLCLVDTSGGADTEALRQGARALERGRTLDYRIPLGPLVEGAGLDPQVVPVSLYEVQLEVVSSPGSAAWIEAGRTLMDGCP